MISRNTQWRCSIVCYGSCFKQTVIWVIPYLQASFQVQRRDKLTNELTNRSHCSPQTVEIEAKAFASSACLLSFNFSSGTLCQSYLIVTYYLFMLNFYYIFFMLSPLYFTKIAYFMGDYHTFMVLQWSFI